MNIKWKISEWARRANEFRKRYFYTSSEVRVMQGEMTQLRYSLYSAKSELEDTRKLCRRLDEVIPKLVKMQIISETGFRSSYQTLYRLVVDLPELSEAFMWGNDDNIIRYIAERLGHQFYNEFRMMNRRRDVQFVPPPPRMTVYSDERKPGE